MMTEATATEWTTRATMEDIEQKANEIKDVLIGEIDYVQMCRLQKGDSECQDDYWNGYYSAVRRVARELGIDLGKAV